ncbi:hypothetical protein Pcinc_027484 [Petrolisthes cinctipes]|uniref:Nephrin n=1 Tax=Petrolisthes cinctipes TaxID=88211 RepID=A0AAE1F401_PETCI|nr:hypothetical protein Pcinc_027484 [Petrolisthes cinctipes]
MAAHASLNLLFAPLEVSVWVSPERVESGQEVSKVMLLVSGEDHGRLITCQAENGVSPSLTANVTLNVLHGPVWVWAPDGELDVREGEDFTISARATANPGPVRYRWYHETNAVDGVGGLEGEAGQLLVEHINRHLCGNYTVVAHTPRGASINATFTINVQYGPEDLLAARRVTVDEDGAATVLCSASGNPTPNITWTRHHNHNNNNHNNHNRYDTNNNNYNRYDTNNNNNSRNDNNNYNHNYHNYHNYNTNRHPDTPSWNTSSDIILASGFGEARLVVELASVSDTGLYLCHATSPIATPPPIATAIVVTQAPTSISEHGEDRVGQAWAPVGGTGLLDCRVKAAPAPTITWTFNTNKLLANGRKYIIHVPQLVDKVTEWSSVLEVRGVTVRDHGRYTCTAHNSRGSHSLTFNLSPPLLPATPWNMNVTVVANSVTLVTWKTNPFGAPPAGFTIRYRLVGATQYQHLDVSGSNATRSTVKNLTPGADYTFAISAYNNRGSSNYTTPSPQVSMFSMVEEGAVSSSVGGRQQRVPRLIILLICLTATTLFVLNVSIVVCFLRRQANKRNMSASSSKTTALEVYTPTSAAPVDEFPLTTVNDGPPPEYQSLESQTRMEESEHTCLISPCSTSHTPEPLVASMSSPTSRSGSPLLLNGGVMMQQSDHLFLPDTNTNNTNTNINTNTTRLNSDNNNAMGGVVSSCSASVPLLLMQKNKDQISSTDDSSNVYLSLNNPDVCPPTTTNNNNNNTTTTTTTTTSGSCDPLLEQQENYPYIDVDQVSLSSQDSSELYGFTHPSKSDGVRNTQQGVRNTQQQGVRNTQQGVLNTQQGVLNTQQGVRNTQQGILNTQQGVLNTQQGVLNTQQGVRNTQQQGVLNTHQAQRFTNQPGTVHSAGYNSQSLHRVSSFKSGLSPVPLSTSPRFPDDTTTPTQGISLGCVSQQPRRSCLKSPHVSGLQRSHSVHNYTYTSLQCVHHHHHASCHDTAFCSNPQLHAVTQATTTTTTGGGGGGGGGGTEANDFLVCYSKPRTRSGLGCTRHNSISGYIGYRSPIRQEMESTQVQPDLCKVIPTSTKRVGWKEVLHESSELGPQSTDDSQLGGQTFQSPVLEAQTFRGSDLGYKVFRGSESGYQASRGSELGYQSSRGSESGYKASRGSESGYKASRGSESGYQASRGSELESVSYRNTEVGHEASRGSTDTSTSSTTSTLTLGPRPPPPPPRCVRQDSIRSNTSDQLNIQDKR